MDAHIITHKISEDNTYTLLLQTQGTKLTIKLMIKISKYRMDVYTKTLNSLKDVDKLEENFEMLEDFK